MNDDDITTERFPPVKFKATLRLSGEVSGSGFTKAELVEAITEMLDAADFDTLGNDLYDYLPEDAEADEIRIELLTYNVS